MSLQEFYNRAKENEEIISKLEARVQELEKSAPAASSDFDKKETVRMLKDELLPEVKKLEKANEGLKKENESLKQQMKGKKSSPSKASSSEKIQVNEDILKRLKDFRSNVKALEDENAALKKENDVLKEAQNNPTSAVAPGARAHLLDRLRKLRPHVVQLEEEKKALEAKLAALTQGSAPAANDSAPAGLVQCTMDSVVLMETYYITSCMETLKKEWKIAELGPLDDEDFQLYLGRDVTALELEDDDDTCNCRFDNHSTQWFPVTVMYAKGAAPAPAPAATTLTCEDIEEMGTYYVTNCMTTLKAAWKEAELGPLDDSDFQIYLSRDVVALEIEDDDDTINCRFDNHSTQWFPVSVLSKEKPGESAAAKDNNKGTQLKSIEEAVEMEIYFITGDMAALKKEWKVCELGPLDDSDFEMYLNREVKVLEIEDDDDTVNVRFDNHSTQWFPVTTLYKR